MGDQNARVGTGVNKVPEMNEMESIYWMYVKNEDY